MRNSRLKWSWMIEISGNNLISAIHWIGQIGPFHWISLNLYPPILTISHYWTLNGKPRRGQVSQKLLVRYQWVGLVPLIVSFRVGHGIFWNGHVKQFYGGGIFRQDRGLPTCLTSIWQFWDVVFHENTSTGSNFQVLVSILLVVGGIIYTGSILCGFQFRKNPKYPVDLSSSHL